MKNRILIALLSCFFSVTTYAQKQSKTAEVTIQTSAKCGMCKQRIERDLSLTKGVESAKVDLKTKAVTVQYNTKKTDATKVKNAISMIGYDADDVIANQTSHDKLPGCCQKSADSHDD